MNIAKNITTGKIEDVSTLEPGHEKLMAISSHKFECSETTCTANLLLCSYREWNIVAPYFKTQKSEKHIPNCSNTVDQFDFSTIGKRSTGVAAFNKMKSYFNQKDQVVAFYNKSKGNVERRSLLNDSNRKAKSAVKTGPIVYTGETEIIEGTTYLMNTKDISLNTTETDSWLNIERKCGINISNTGKKIINSNENVTLVIFISKIFKKNNWQYSYDTKILYIVNKELVHED